MAVPDAKHYQYTHTPIQTLFFLHTNQKNKTKTCRKKKQKKSSLSKKNTHKDENKSACIDQIDTRKQRICSPYQLPKYHTCLHLKAKTSQCLIHIFQFHSVVKHYLHKNGNNKSSTEQIVQNTFQINEHTLILPFNKTFCIPDSAFLLF